jgi:hypothetical protein
MNFGRRLYQILADKNLDKAAAIQLISRKTGFSVSDVVAIVLDKKNPGPDFLLELADIEYLQLNQYDIRTLLESMSRVHRAV